MFSDYFTWNGESQDGKIISEIIYDWDNPEIGFDLTKENFEHWKEYLQTGKTDYFTKEELKKKFRGVKKNRMKRNGF
jgi:YHS domain-containing protein